jgi:hypothetical protein
MVDPSESGWNLLLSDLRKLALIVEGAKLMPDRIEPYSPAVHVRKRHSHVV